MLQIKNIEFLQHQDFIDGVDLLEDLGVNAHKYDDISHRILWNV